MTAEDKLRQTYLLQGIVLLRQAIGGAKTTELLRSGMDDVQYAIWIELITSKDKATIEALSYILTGLGLDPDELAKELDKLDKELDPTPDELATQPVGLL